MRFAKRKVRRGTEGDGRLTVGFLPTLDCAVLVAAEELGLFRKHGLAVKLSREVGWATIREKLLHEEIDAAAAHASMAFSIYCGISVIRRACLTSLLLGQNHSAITLSVRLREAGVVDASSLARMVRDGGGANPLHFGVVLGLSSQNHHLRAWLKSGGIDPDRDVRITSVPSSLVFESLKAGHLDGYCVAEPWNSAAVLEGYGWIATTTQEIDSGLPEKVLLVLQDFADSREEEHLHMVAALIEAGEFCDAPENRAELARMLASSRHFSVPETWLRNALCSPMQTGMGAREIPGFATFSATRVGMPSRAAGRRTLDMIRELGPRDASPALHADAVARVFRPDLFDRAMEIARPGSSPRGAGVRPSRGGPAVLEGTCARPGQPGRLVSTLRESVVTTNG